MCRVPTPYGRVIIWAKDEACDCRIQVDRDFLTADQAESAAVRAWHALTAHPVAAGETNHPAIPDSSRPVAAVVAVPVWVSADTPPTNERTVIVRCSTGQMYMDRYDLVRGWDVSPYVMAGSVTHWQPLPAPPQAPEGT